MALSPVTFAWEKQKEEKRWNWSRMHGRNDKSEEIKQCVHRRKGEGNLNENRQSSESKGQFLTTV